LKATRFQALLFRGSLTNTAFIENKLKKNTGNAGPQELETLFCSGFGYREPFNFGRTHERFT
jgi:hypothetical protein